MQVILKKDVDHLGCRNDVVDVRRGYWRNYLRPKGLAEVATSELVSELTEAMERRRELDARNESEAREIADVLNGTEVTIPANAGPQGKLFGSVGAADIAKAIENYRKMRVDSSRIKLDEPIKTLGTFMVTIEVFQGVTAEVKTTVVESATAVAPPVEVTLADVTAAGTEVEGSGDKMDESAAAVAGAGNSEAGDTSAEADASAE